MSTRTSKQKWHDSILDYAPENSTMRHVLTSLYFYMDKTGVTLRVSATMLCEDTSLSRPSVIRYLTDAADMGWVDVIQIGHSGKKWEWNQYHATLPDAVAQKILMET